jgi:hypothetical protein
MPEMWEALARGVQRAARYIVPVGVLAASFAAAHASASPAPTLFKLSIVASAHAQWDHTGVSSPFGDCDRTIRSEGIRNTRFRTAKPSLIRVVDGRVLAGTLRGLTGTVTLSGANTVTDVCGPETREAIQDCVTTKRSFRGGTIGVVGLQQGSITLRPVRNVRLRTITCPREPAEVVRTPVGPVPGPLRVSAAALANKRIARITLTGAASRTLNFGPVERGTLRQRSAWRLTLQRVQP